MTNKERYVELCSREPGIALYSQPFWLNAVSEGSGGGTNVRYIGTFVFMKKKEGSSGRCLFLSGKNMV